MGWRQWNVGDTVRWSWNDFDGKGNTVGVLTAKETDHAIVTANGMNLWIDDDTQGMFTKESA